MYYLRQHKHLKKTNIVYNFSLIAGVLLLIVTWPLAFVLPVSVSFENGFLENLQVVVLIFGGIYNFYLINYSVDKQIMAFHRWCSVLCVFMSLRELSWGRIFYQINMEKTGPVFVAMTDYIWRTEAYFVMACFILFLFIYMLKYLPLMRIFYCRLPWSIIIAMIIAATFSYIGDHGMIVGKLKGQIAEEFGELAFYTFIPALCIYYHRQLSM